MSHFTVMVIGNDVEGQLAPYQENNMGDCPEQYLKFNDTEDEMLQEYENESSERVVMPDGRLLMPWDEEFRVPGSFGHGGGTHKVPEGLERREVPFKELYPTFEEFAAQWRGYANRDPKTGRYGYWDNPQTKWDWYQIGGRWSGMLLLKPGAKGKYGQRSWTNEGKADDMDRCDQARKGDIDLDGMRDEAGSKAARQPGSGRPCDV